MKSSIFICGGLCSLQMTMNISKDHDCPIYHACLKCNVEDLMTALVGDPDRFRNSSIHTTMVWLNETIQRMNVTKRFANLFLTNARIEYLNAMLNLCNNLWNPYKNLNVRKYIKPEYEEYKFIQSA
jgi:hypothetical protein